MGKPFVSLPSYPASGYPLEGSNQRRGEKRIFQFLLIRRRSRSLRCKKDGTEGKKGWKRGKESDGAGGTTLPQRNRFVNLSWPGPLLPLLVCALFTCLAENLVRPTASPPLPSLSSTACHLAGSTLPFPFTIPAHFASKYVSSCPLLYYEHLA